MVSLSMLAIGLATIFLCIRSRFVGCGYLVPASYTAIFMGPSLYALQLGGLALVFGMTVVAGGLALQLEPLIDDQELDSRASTGTIYWEGAVRALASGRRVGHGYLELTGYGASLRL